MSLPLKCSWCDKRVDVKNGVMCKCGTVVYCSAECLTQDVIIHDSFCKLADPVELLKIFMKMWVQKKVDGLIRNFEYGIRVYVILADHTVSPQTQQRDTHIFKESKQRIENEKFYGTKTCMPNELISSPNYFSTGLSTDYVLREKSVAEVTKREEIYSTFMMFDKLPVLETYHKDEGLIFVFAVDIIAQVTHSVVFSAYDTIANSIQ